jgi:hypothetical protein
VCRKQVSPHIATAVKAINPLLQFKECLSNKTKMITSLKQSSKVLILKRFEIVLEKVDLVWVEERVGATQQR